MKRLTSLAALVMALATIAVPGSALAAPGGDSNAGDFWVDTLGAPQGAGHEMDPHLPCANVAVWGDKLADHSDAYKVIGIPPSGTKMRAYASTWTYDRATGGNQVIDVIDVQQLIAAAVANGDKPVNKQGFHFKVALAQDPHKFKTFWVECAIPSPPGGGGGGDTPPPNPTMIPPPGTQPQGEQPGQQVLGERVNAPAKRKAAHKKARKHRRHHRKHHKVTKRQLMPAFTG